MNFLIPLFPSHLLLTDKNCVCSILKQQIDKSLFCLENALLWRNVFLIIIIDYITYIVSHLEIIMFNNHNIKNNDLVARLSWIKADLGISIDLKSDDKELKVVMPEQSKTCVTTFTKKLVSTFQLSRTRSGHYFLK